MESNSPEMVGIAVEMMVESCALGQCRLSVSYETLLTMA